MVTKLDNPEVWSEFLDKITDGWSVYKTCKSLNVKDDTFYRYIKEHKQKEGDYIKARQTRGDRCLDKIEKYQNEVYDRTIPSDVARVLIDTEKWKACKFYPKMYGDKQEVELSGNVNTNISVEIIKNNKE